MAEVDPPAGSEGARPAGPAAELRDQVATVLEALTDERARAYFDEPIPSELDGTMASLVDGLVKCTLGEREQMLDEWFDHWQQGALRTFCVRVCSLAVREHSVDLVGTALTAAALEGFRLDPRDGGYQSLGVAYHTARALEADPDELFAAAATFANPVMEQHLRTFLLRPDLDRILSLMGYAEGSDDDGFRYEYPDPPPPSLLT